jgi:hypothetical protein
MKWRLQPGSGLERAWEFIKLGLQRAWAFIRPLVQFLLHGPQHRYDDEPPGLGETLFPWPVRIMIVVGSYLLARLWVHTNAAGQIGWTLEYAGVVAISLVASFWLYIFVVDIVFSLLWLVLTLMKPPDPVEDPYLYWIHHGVELINRQLAHIEAFLIWMGVLLPLIPRIDVQIPALLGLALIGPPLIDWITELRHPEVLQGKLDLQSTRRPLIYFFMILGLLILVGRSTDQRLNLLRLVAAFVIVMAVRFKRHKVRKRHVDSHGDQVTAFRQHQRQLTRGIDVVLGPIFMLLSVVGVLALSLWARQHHDQLTRETLDGPPPDPQTCVAEPGGPREADMSMFIVSDSQVHELGGKRFPGQTELADLLVPSAVRPVELDMLGAASVAQLQHGFEDVVRNARGRPVYWAHLGDFADLSCAGELARAVKMFTGFARPQPVGLQASDMLAPLRRPKLAGVAPGNHDMSFTGNFFWSPYWSDACKSSRADKQESNQKIGQLLDPDGDVLSKQAHVSRPERSWLSRWLLGAGGVVTVTPLGTILHDKKPRTVVAIFIDTGDDATFDWGVAGLFGTYSGYQDERLKQYVEELKVKKPDEQTEVEKQSVKDSKAELREIEDPLWLVFAHHPLGELTGPSRARLEKRLAWLDDDPLEMNPNPPEYAERKPRVLGIIAAHTHRAETHRLCVAKRVVREIVVGSTIDSAQQGALLEIGADQKGAASIRLKTVQTVARNGFTCGTKPPMIEAEECERIVARLKCDPSCEPMFDEGSKTARDCSELEQNSGFGEAVRELITSTSPVDPDDIKRAQTTRARRLMKCICRPESASAENSCGRPGEPPAGHCAPIADKDLLDDDVFNERITDRLKSGGNAALKELACLSWAASAQQQHKARGMNFASALRCAFDDRTIPAAQESVATLDVQPCQ